MHTQDAQTSVFGNGIEALSRPLLAPNGRQKQVHHGRGPGRRVAQHRLSDEEPAVWSHGIAQMRQDLNTFLVAEVVKTAADGVYQGA